MTLDDLLDLVRASEPADWSMLTPITLNRVRLYGDDVPEVSLEGHQYVAHYRRDLDIALAWGAEQHDGKPWEGAWGNGRISLTGRFTASGQRSSGVDSPCIAN